jgi:sulfate permease, SulP family
MKPRNQGTTPESNHRKGDGSGEARRIGLLQGVRPTTRGGAIGDAPAEFQLAAMNIPQVLGYTKIAGPSIVTGLYTPLLPSLAFALFGSSRYLVVSADSATAAILNRGLADIALPASARYVELAGLVALLTALLLLLARLLKLDFLADFLSQTVLVGFLTGVGIQVGIAVLGLDAVRKLPEIHLPTAILSLTIVAIIFGLRSVNPKIPGSLIATICAIAVS